MKNKTISVSLKSIKTKIVHNKLNRVWCQKEYKIGSSNLVEKCKCNSILCHHIFHHISTSDKKMTVWIDAKQKWGD